jgi:hypothetical protein
MYGPQHQLDTLGGPGTIVVLHPDLQPPAIVGGWSLDDAIGSQPAYVLHLDPPACLLRDGAMYFDLQKPIIRRLEILGLCRLPTECYVVNAHTAGGTNRGKLLPLRR